MTNSKTNKIDLVTACSALIANLPTLVGTSTVDGGGTSYTSAQLLAPLQAYVPMPAATANAKTAYSKAVAAEAAAKATAMTMIEDVVKPYLQYKLGKSSPDLVKYGLQPAKAPQKSAATKAEAAQKAAATRKALGTKGTSQKKAAKKALEAEPAAAQPAASTPAAPGAAPVATKS